MGRIGRSIRIGTRGSPLALAQTELVRAALVTRFPGITVEQVRIQTKGDKLLDKPLADLGDKGLFVAEIEDALRTGRIDLAVHSSKDMPSDLPDDMSLVAYLPRANPRDVLIVRDSAVTSLAQLPQGARVGTGSPRRRCQLLAVRPDIVPLDIRGNVGTRLAKLHDGQYDAIVLAAAGLDRLYIEGLSRIDFDRTLMIPSVGQGAIGIEIFSEREDIREILSSVNDRKTQIEVELEREYLRIVGGGCHAAVAANATCSEDLKTVQIAGMVGSQTSGLFMREDIDISLAEGMDQALDTVRNLAGRLLLQGRHLLDTDRGSSNTAPGILA